MRTPAARAVEFDTRSGRRSWTAVNEAGLPIADLESFLSACRALNKSENTVKAYARQLSLFWRWLDARQRSWEDLTFTELSEFLLVYRRAIYPLETRSGDERSQSSARQMAAAIKEYFEFQRFEGRGPQRLELSKVSARNRRTQNAFLAEPKRGSKNRLVAGFRDSPSKPDLINFEEDFTSLLAAAQSSRDQLLLSALYDGGLRIGQALGVRHGDLDIPRKTIRVVRRDNNSNRSLSKMPDVFEVIMPRRFFDLYRRYLLDELVPRSLDSDYLFVNLSNAALGRPMSYSNGYQQIVSIGSRASVELTPHTLRHTHATSLAKAGWTAAEIAARLGQRHPHSADKYIHLASADLADRLTETAHLIWPEKELNDAD